MRRSGVMVAVFVALLWLAGNSYAYNVEGHFFTLLATLHETTDLNEQDVRIIEFCAQLPDNVYELDAVHVMSQATLGMNRPDVIDVLTLKVLRRWGTTTAKAAWNWAWSTPDVWAEKRMERWYNGSCMP